MKRIAVVFFTFFVLFASAFAQEGYIHHSLNPLTMPASLNIGDLLVATSTTELGTISDVATGSVFVSGGMGAAPLWSTTTNAGIIDKIVTKNAPYTLGTDAAKENYGGMVYLTAAATLTLPAAVVGMSGCVMALGTFSISVDVNIADHWVLNGVALAAGNKVTSTGVAGDTLCWSAGAANTWYILPGANVNWIDGGA